MGSVAPAPSVLTATTTPTRRREKGESEKVNEILPASIEEQINRADRQRSLWIGISAAVVAAGSVYRLIWMLYLAMTFGVFFGALLQLVVWGAIGAVAAVAAIGFLTCYNRGS